MTRRMFKLGMAAALLAAGLVLIPTLAGAADGEPVARMGAGAAAIEWHPLVTSYEGMVLTVSTPGGYVVERRFKAGETPSFSAFDSKGNARPDGVYNYELRVVPVVDSGVRERLRAYRESGDRSILAEVASKLPKGPSVQSGSFAILGGAFQSVDAVEPRRTVTKGLRNESGKALRNVTAADQVIPDDLIVQGSACVGLDCVNNENFGFDTIRLKENNLRIHFDDTSTQAGFPANDWRLIANDSAGGGQSKFSIEDSTGARTPFTVEAGATTNSVYVDSTGRVGFRTSTPVLDLHVNTSNTPALRLEQNNSGGFTAQTWDVAGNEANFFVRDVTGGSRLPFRIRPGAPTSSIDISADGDVGIGTASPDHPLEITQAGAVEVALENTSGGNSVKWFFQVDDDANKTLKWSREGGGGTVVTINRRLDADGTTFVVAGSVSGTAFINSSSRELKTDIVNVDPKEILARLTGIPIARWRFKEGSPAAHVGPMAEDFEQAFGFGTDGKTISMTDANGIALAAIQGLNEIVRERDAEISDLKSRLEALEKLVQSSAAAPE